ncbi:Cro/CI family transcriptional regulator [Serratia liquefaciens]|jgi:transcriptional repressor of cell division inhibition gene dicB|uniref:Cro/CI family transcriptional regulator n=1 Tax=Serratia liquefaciens TaxID=614 RepID=UPI00217B0003|nr:Cro/CI family transcriptional regulator [Serratia liquefaciens]CAI0790238.1 DNA-binding transcriptional regulator DicC [Serratia liquefaciens]CAI1606663.1 DNA-binding transcriptional regulator DicC [Serratia liquefaciens]
MRKAEVISYFGGVVKTAEALGLKHPSVSGWPEIIPEGRAYQIENITKGKLKFNPDLYPHNDTRSVSA